MFEPELEDLSKQDICCLLTQVQVQVQGSQFHVIPRYLMDLLTVFPEAAKNLEAGLPEQKQRERV